MRKHAFPALRVIDGAAGEIAANGHANYAGRGKPVVRAPADERQFVAQLHHRRPDVVEELNLHHRLQPARGHASGAAHEVGFRDRRVEYPFGAELDLQARGQLEHTALALDQFLFEIFFAAAVGDVFPENNDAFILPHLIAQGSADEIGHGFSVSRLLVIVCRRVVFVMRQRLRVKSRRRGVEISRIDVPHHALDRGGRGLQRVIDRNLQIVIDLLLQAVDAFFVENVLADQKQLQPRHRIARGVAAPLDLGAVKRHIVGKRVRVRTNHVGMNESRAVSFAAIGSSSRKRGVCRGQIGAVNLLEMKVWEAADQARNVSTRHLHFDWNRNRVFVIFHHEDQRQVSVRCGIQRFPELAFAARALAKGNQRHFVGVGNDGLELAVVAGCFFRHAGMMGHITRNLGAAYRLQNLRAGRRGAGDNIQPRIAPVRGHLPPAGTGVCGGAYSLQQHLVRRRAQSQAERPVAIIRIEPVVSGFKSEGRSHADGFMAGAGDLEEDFLLLFELDLAVVQSPRGIHQAIGVNELLAGQALVGFP